MELPPTPEGMMADIDQPAAIHESRISRYVAFQHARLKIRRKRAIPQLGQPNTSAQPSFLDEAGTALVSVGLGAGATDVKTPPLRERDRTP